MIKICSIPLVAIAMLAATAGAARAQHVVGGMGEDVRIGAFGGRADDRLGGRVLPDKHGLDTTGRNGARTRAGDRQAAHAAGTRAKALSLPPGRNLP